MVRMGRVLEGVAAIEDVCMVCENIQAQWSEAMLAVGHKRLTAKAHGWIIVRLQHLAGDAQWGSKAYGYTRKCMGCVFASGTTGPAD